MLSLPAGKIEWTLINTKVLRLRADDSADADTGSREIRKPRFDSIHHHVRDSLGGMLY